MVHPVPGRLDSNQRPQPQDRLLDSAREGLRYILGPILGHVTHYGFQVYAGGILPATSRPASTVAAGQRLAWEREHREPQSADLLRFSLAIEIPSWYPTRLYCVGERVTPQERSPS